MVSCFREKLVIESPILMDLMKMRKLILPFLLIAFFTVSVCAASQAEKCGKCHSDSLIYKEWQTSGHAKALKTLVEGRNARQNCLKCHSADYKRAKANPWLSGKDIPTVKTAVDAVSCSICHKHKGEKESVLLMPVEKLCADCHVLFCGG